MRLECTQRCASGLVKLVKINVIFITIRDIPLIIALFVAIIAYYFVGICIKGWYYIVIEAKGKGFNKENQMSNKIASLVASALNKPNAVSAPEREDARIQFNLPSIAYREKVANMSRRFGKKQTEFCEELFTAAFDDLCAQLAVAEKDAKEKAAQKPV